MTSREHQIESLFDLIKLVIKFITISCHYVANVTVKKKISPLRLFSISIVPVSHHFNEKKISQLQ
jgi:hypothetical protein